MNTLEAAKLILLYLSDYVESDSLTSISDTFDGDNEAASDFICDAVDTFNSDHNKNISYYDVGFYIGPYNQVLEECNLTDNEFVDSEVGNVAIMILEDEGYIRPCFEKEPLGILLVSDQIEPAEEDAFLDDSVEEGDNSLAHQEQADTIQKTWVSWDQVEAQPIDASWNANVSVVKKNEPSEEDGLHDTMNDTTKKIFGYLENALKDAKVKNKLYEQLLGIKDKEIHELKEENMGLKSKLKDHFSEDAFKATFHTP